MRTGTDRAHAASRKEICINAFAYGSLRLRLNQAATTGAFAYIHTKSQKKLATFPLLSKHGASLVAFPRQFLTK